MRLGVDNQTILSVSYEQLLLSCPVLSCVRFCSRRSFYRLFLFIIERVFVSLPFSLYYLLHPIHSHSRGGERERQTEREKNGTETAYTAARRNRSRTRARGVVVVVVHGRRYLPSQG